MDLPREPDMISEFRRRTIQWLGDAEKNARRKNCEERVQEWVPHIYIYIYIYDISRLRVKVDLVEVECEGVDWIKLVLDMTE